VGVLLVAYALLGSRASAFEMRPPVDQFGRPLVAGGRVLSVDGYGVPATDGCGVPVPHGYSTLYQSYPCVTHAPQRTAYPAAQYVSYDPAGQPVRTVVTQAVPRQVVTERVQRAPRRDWKKTALVIGGSTAGGAGLGAIFGGKKGALVGAAIGGGASTIYEATKR
jgi:uncharacterized protein YcfJ